MQRSVFTFTLATATVLAVSLFKPTTVRGDDVTVTTAAAVINCTGFNNSDTGRIVLSGQDFDFLFSYDGIFGRVSCSQAPIRLSLNTDFAPPYDGVIEFVTYQGVTTMFTRGILSFDETSISGFVEGRAGPNGAVLFTVNFSGSGVGTFSNTQATFNSVPEPATMLLLGSGALMLGGVRRWRKTHSRTESKV